MRECIRCSRCFNDSNAYHQHIANSTHHNICNDCQLDFSTWAGLKEHWVQSPRHMYCQYCHEHYANRGELDHHYDVAHSWCSACRIIFKDDVGLKEHYRQSPLHHYCQPCNRLFSSASNLTSVDIFVSIALKRPTHALSCSISIHPPTDPKMLPVLGIAGVDLFPALLLSFTSKMERVPRELTATWSIALSGNTTLAALSPTQLVSLVEAQERLSKKLPTLPPEHRGTDGDTSAISATVCIPASEVSTNTLRAPNTKTRYMFAVDLLAGSASGCSAPL